MQTKVLQYSNKQALIQALEQSAKDTLPYFDLPAPQLQLSYGPGKWNVRQLLHHITDAETVLYERIRRAICKPGQVIWAFDQESWAIQLDYNLFPMQINKDIFQSVRKSVIHLANEFYDSKGDHSFIHSQVGKRSLRKEFDKIAWHNLGHLQQIQLALEK